MKRIIFAMALLIVGVAGRAPQNASLGALLGSPFNSPLSSPIGSPLSSSLSTLFGSPLSSPLSGTRWKGDLHLESPTPAIMDFHDDTLAIFHADTKALIEIMIYTVRDSVFTIRKLSGQSDCDNVVSGRYRFSLSGQGMDVHLVADSCDDRSMALMDTHWEKTR